MAEVALAEHPETPVCKAVKNCTIPVDIVLQSSEGKRLGAHAKNLGLFNQAFPEAGSIAHSIEDVVKLDEPTDILLLLLRFSHYEDHRSLSTLPIDKLLALTDAADKYGNFFALTACREAINRLSPKSPQESVKLLPYRVMNGEFDESLENLLRSTMNVPLREVAHRMRHCTGAYMIYTLYRDKWHSCMNGYEKAINDCILLQSEWAKDTRGKAATTFRAILSSYKLPVTASLDSASQATRAIVDSIDYLVNTHAPFKDWIARVRAVLEGFPRWEQFVGLEVDRL